MTDKQLERLLARPAEGAKMLGISRSKIYEMLNAGDLPCLRLGKTWRIPIDELRRWIADKSAR